MRERSFGSFERNFQVPDVVETDRIEANFKNGVLSLTLPKSAAAQKAEKKTRSRAPKDPRSRHWPGTEYSPGHALHLRGAPRMPTLHS